MCRIMAKALALCKGVKIIMLIKESKTMPLSTHKADGEAIFCYNVSTLHLIYKNTFENYYI